MTKRWDTYRIAFRYGAPFGVVYELVQMPHEYWSLNTPALAYAIGAIAGGAVGGALLFGAVSGLRNLLLRAR